MPTHRWPKFVLPALLLALVSIVGRDTRAAPEDHSVMDPSAIDSTVSPCDDFYQYACGNWLARTTLPSDQSSWSRSFSTIYDGNLNTIKTVLENYAKGKIDPVVPNAKKLGAFYASCMDESAIEKETATALKERLALIEKLRTKKDVPALLARLHLEKVPAFFSVAPSADLKVPTLTLAELYQDGMGLPDSSYYTKPDDKIRKLYQAHQARMFGLAGSTEAEAQAEAAQAFAIEMRLAQKALPPEKQQDPSALYHPTDFAGLKEQTPEFDWAPYFAALGISKPKLINVTEPEFLKEMNAVLAETELPALRSYFRWRVLQTLAPSLGAKVFAEYFSFTGQVLNGQTDPGSRWKRCVQATSTAMGEAVGQAFVKKSFSPRAKDRVLELIDKLRLAFEQDFQTLDWLDAPTRQQALEKLALITRKIGYPDQWRDYASLEVGKKPYWRNKLIAATFNSRYDLGKIGGRTNPDDWHMTPQTVNAYYDPNVNQINFPAGILQPPFFSDSASDAENFGAIGMVIGHEMTHAFDTAGSQFDGHGVQRDWWSPTVKTLFNEKAQCLRDQYSKYEVLPGLNVNGDLTITENIADQGGLKLAFRAFKLATEGRTLPPVAVPNSPSNSSLDGNQQFFVSMAQLWCSKDSDASLIQEVSGDPHSPSRFRVNGTIVNSPDFTTAFQCAAGKPMSPVIRCPMW